MHKNMMIKMIGYWFLLSFGGFTYAGLFSSSSLKWDYALHGSYCIAFTFIFTYLVLIRPLMRKMITQ